MRPSMLAVVVAMLSACSTPPQKTPNASTNGATNGATNNTSGNNVTTDCVGEAPGCGTCSAPVCQGGSWQCEATPCPGGCLDDPPGCAPNEVARCVQQDWYCEAAPVQDAPPGCGYEAMSDLSGVSITFPGDRCSWTLAEVAAGIEIPFAVNIDQAHEITPTSQQNGCDEPGPSGLQVFGSISGNDQNYCICDVGLCMDNSQTLTLSTGVTLDTYSWDGRNWFGPSDTGNAPGQPFPAGQYTFEVRALGTSADEPYEVYGRLTIELVP